MAINIQEILHPSDSNSIKFEKINYNFDQILANGGGPVGPKGQKGDQGQVGSTGQKGEKGEIGNTGLKGDSGATDSPWYKVQLDANTDNQNEVTILKPKRGTDLNLPIIWLGDSTFTEDSNDGDVSTNARLTIATDSVFANYLKLFHDNTHGLILTSEESGAFKRFAFKNNFGSSNIEFGATTNKISLVATSSTAYVQGEGITIKTTGSNNLSLETSGNGILDVDINAEFKGYVRLPYGGTGQRPVNPQVGMIRFNSDLDIAEAYYYNGGSPEWRELCTDCGSGVADSIGIIGGNIDAYADGSPVVTDTISIGGGNIDANSDGSPSSSVPNPTATPNPTAQPTPAPTSGSGGGSGPAPTPSPTSGSGGGSGPIATPSPTDSSGGGSGSGSGPITTPSPTDSSGGGSGGGGTSSGTGSGTGSGTNTYA
jgi:hypothetical protein